MRRWGCVSSGPAGPRERQCGTDDGRPGGSSAGHHEGAVQVKLEAGARPSSPGADVLTDNGASGEAFPVPSDAGDGETHFDTGVGQPLEGASGDDDGLPSSSPVDEAPASLAGPGGASLGVAAALASPGDEASTAGDDLLLLPPAGGGRGVDGPGGEARTPEAGDGCLASCVEATGPGAQPHGVVSPPATTVFGGGIGVALGADGCGCTIVAHSVEVSESDSDLGASPPTAAAAAELAATADPEDGPSRPAPRAPFNEQLPCFGTQVRDFVPGQAVRTSQAFGLGERTCSTRANSSAGSAHRIAGAPGRPLARARTARPARRAGLPGRRGGPRALANRAASNTGLPQCDGG